MAADYILCSRLLKSSKVRGARTSPVKSGMDKNQGDKTVSRQAHDCVIM